MGLKLRRFRAKLNWKQKTPVPQIVCLKYHITSEFAEALPRTPIQAVTTDTKRQQFLANEKAVLAEKLKTNEVNKEPNQNKTPPSDVRLNELSTLQSNSDSETAQQPKSILKKSTNSPDLEDHKKSTLIFMTENHDVDEEELTSKQVRVRRESVEESALQFQSNFDSSDNKIVNWRETIEFISVKDDPKLSTQTQNESEDEVDGLEENMYYDNESSYSNQAASIFFSSGESKHNENHQNSFTA